VLMIVSDFPAPQTPGDVRPSCMKHMCPKCKSKRVPYRHPSLPLHQPFSHRLEHGQSPLCCGTGSLTSEWGRVQLRPWKVVRDLSDSEFRQQLMGWGLPALLFEQKQTWALFEPKVRRAPLRNTVLRRTTTSLGGARDIHRA
jgi:hypothetical protein